MKLLELDAKEISTGYYDPNEDALGSRVPSDTRKPLLTLRRLNRLKRIRALRKLEQLKREDLFTVMYSAPAESGSGPGGF
jgi:hypothetical protein